MSYSNLDSIFEWWAKTHGLIIHKIFKDVEVRSIDMVGPQGKHFQIWIDEPDQAGNTSVHVWDMKKKKRDFTATKSSLKNTLESGLPAGAIMVLIKVLEAAYQQAAKNLWQIESFIVYTRTVQ